MIGVLRHGPERHRQVRPKIRGMRQAELALRPVLPILRLAVLAIRRQNPALQLHRLHVEVVVVGHRREPDVLAGVLPVRLRAAPLLALPGDAVAHDDVPVQHALQRAGRLPIAAHVKARRGLEQRQHADEPALEPLLILRQRPFPKTLRAEPLREVVRRVQDEQVHES